LMYNTSVLILYLNPTLSGGAMHTTVDDLFTLAISAENAAESLYTGLASKFAHHPDVAAFWQRYAGEEDGHARWLKEKQAQLSEEQRTAPADETTVIQLRDVLTFSVPKALANIGDLEQALKIATELENSETNAIFEFLIENFADDERTQTFLRAQLRSHISNLLIDFPIQFRSAAMRREIKAQS